MNRVHRIIIIFLMSLFLVAISHAEIQIDGYFIAQDECAAFHSKKKKTNPRTRLLPLNPN